MCRIRLAASSAPPLRSASQPVLGEPSKVTIGSWPCQPLFQGALSGMPDRSSTCVTRNVLAPFEIACGDIGDRRAVVTDLPLPDWRPSGEPSKSMGPRRPCQPRPSLMSTRNRHVPILNEIEMSPGDGLWTLVENRSVVFQGAVGASARPRLRQRP